MFTDRGNQKLYGFDSMAGTPTGALNVAVSPSLIELLPVTLAPVSFTYTYDITWAGAVVTFDNSTPMCIKYDDTTPTGLWLLAEYPPTLTLTAKS